MALFWPDRIDIRIPTPRQTGTDVPGSPDFTIGLVQGVAGGHYIANRNMPHLSLKDWLTLVETGHVYVYARSEGWVDDDPYEGRYWGDAERRVGWVPRDA